MVAPNIGNNEHERYVFVADEVVFQVLHPPVTDLESAAAIRARIIAAIVNFLRPGGIEIGVQLPENDWRNRLAPPTANSRIVTFSSLTQLEGSERFSLIPIKLIRPDPESLTQDDVINLLKDIYTDLGDSFIVPGGGGDDDNDERGKDDKDEDEKEKDDEKRKDDDDRKDDDKDKRDRFRSIPLDDTGEIRLKSISPNWLASDLHHGGATGGPGSLPASKAAPPNNRPGFQLEGTINSLSNYRRPGAQIAILDTIQPATFPADIQAIFSANPGMNTVPYIYPDLAPLAAYAQLPHHYQMPDHGTFIASIIRAIVPSAQVHLYEVLNSYGVGCFISIAQGVVDAVNQRGSNTPALILSCSFMLDDNLQDLDIEMEILKQKNIHNLLRTSMRDVFNWATTTSNLNVVVVAASGNDSSQGNRKDARYPASFYEVVSVAALPKNYPKSNGKYRPSSYSNRAHSREPNKGNAYSIATFGGEMLSGSSPKDGVLGVYIGEIPTQNTNGTFSQTPPANSTNWAEWSGTSFAAPIITSLLAMPTIPQVTPSSDPYLTTDNEHVIRVQQG
ncbi:MAG TPA: S8/S53 family peptidase [Anaerolineales bacterium]|nr:S8/S53 family peptidase [Anaerolineales bacterium]